MRVRIYIDGLNFYYGVARPYNIKWVDLEALLKRLVSKIDRSYTIEKIFLFTSKVIGNKEIEERQNNYLKAIKHHSPCTEIRMGRFQHSRKKARLLRSGKVEEVEIREEKETDVNIACQIVDDAHTSAGKDFEICCLVSNDGDLSAALRVKQRLNQKTILILPRKVARGYSQSNVAPPSKALKKLVPKKCRILEIAKKDLKDCQLPAKVGKYSPPNSRGWKII